MKDVLFAFAFVAVLLCAAVAYGQTPEKPKPVVPYSYAPKVQPPESYVFGTEEGTFVASFDKPWKRLFKEAGQPVGRNGGYVWHDLRHEYCSSVADHGANIHELRELARHADITTTQRYLKASDERLRGLQKAREKRPA